eukprot:COSAG02_NODE_7310_length_3070_cov_26.598788_2_plen_801_part_01
MSAELTRQSSRYHEVFDFLVEQVKLPAASADGYAVRLVDDGYDTVDLLLGLSVQALKVDFAFKAGHALQLEKVRTEVDRVSSAAMGGGGSSSATISSATVDSFEEELSAMTKVDVDAFAEHLGLDEETILYVAEDKDTEEETKSFLVAAILDELQVGGALYTQGIAAVKKRAKAFGLSTEAIKAASTGKVDKKASLLRLIFDEIKRQAGIGAVVAESVAPLYPSGLAIGEPVGRSLGDGSTVELAVLADGKHEIVGRGGSGVVVVGIRTRRSGVTERVACKTLVAGSSEKDVQKFHREYEINLRASQNCAGAVRTYGCVHINGSLYLVMKLYASDFAELLEQQEGPLPLLDAVHFGLQICAALSELHLAGIVVRDLKPSNLLVDTSKKLVISDFGIAGLLDMTSITTNGQAGTAQYMSPEQFDSDLGKATEPTDVWAWACIMVQMLSGQTPWPGATANVIMGNLFKKKTPQLPERVACPAELRELLTRCFRIVPAERPTTPEVEAVLRTIAASLETDKKSALRMTADALLQGSWAKRDSYTFVRLVDVVDVTDSEQNVRYEQYKARLAAELGGGDHTTADWETTYCQLLFHGCAEEALPLIAKEGFRKDKQTTSAGSWQRFGPGFYFALQASKSHEYPIGLMRALESGTHTRSMLLCKVVKGRVYRTEQNIDTLQGKAPEGFESVLGVATADGSLKYDELVVYDPAAILPWLKVTYEFIKKIQAAASAGQGSIEEPQHSSEEELLKSEGEDEAFMDEIEQLQKDRGMPIRALKAGVIRAGVEPDSAKVGNLRAGEVFEILE